MFQFFKKKSILYSPVNGICIPITEVPDEMFAKKIIGNGVPISRKHDIFTL